MFRVTHVGTDLAVDADSIVGDKDCVHDEGGNGGKMCITEKIDLTRRMNWTERR